MCPVWIKVTNNIAGGLRTEPTDGPFAFSLQARGLAQQIAVEISPSGDRISAKAQVLASEALVQALHLTPVEGSLTEDLEAEVLGVIRSLSSASHRVLRLLQQETQDHSLLPHNELLGIRGGFQWSDDGTEWRQLPLHGGRIAFAMHVLGRLNGSLHSTIQLALDSDEMPLLAYEHLYQAERSDGLRFKWIEATTAAELAVKEILIRITPNIKPLLEHVPSPPIRQLYGAILQAYTGQRSPYLKALAQGAERRNRLIHQPEEVPLDDQQVFDYLSTVRSAIRHLLDLHRSLRDNAAQQPGDRPPDARAAADCQ
jgi:hypothetical protein